MLSRSFSVITELLVRFRLKVLKSSADLQLYDRDFQAEEAPTLEAFADNASAIRDADSDNDYVVIRSQYAGRWSRMKGDKLCMDSYIIALLYRTTCTV